MAFESDFEDLMPITVTVHPFSSEDAAGVPTYGASRTTLAYIEDDEKNARWEDGVEIVPKRVIYTNDSAITEKDKIELPAGFGEPLETIAMVLERRYDEEGYHHTVVRA
jgi:hypothetical protein